MIDVSSNFASTAVSICNSLFMFMVYFWIKIKLSATFLSLSWCKSILTRPSVTLAETRKMWHPDTSKSCDKRTQTERKVLEGVNSPGNSKIQLHPAERSSNMQTPTWKLEGVVAAINELEEVVAAIQLHPAERSSNMQTISGLGRRNARCKWR
jgi:hypothetical protein